MRLNLKLVCILAAGITLSAAMPSPAAVIISQYYEGTSNNKFIELFNSGASAVDLAAGEFKLSLYSNAAREAWKDGTASTPAATTLALTGSLAPGATLLLSHASATIPAYAVPAAITNNGVINFNGDDSIVLWSGATYSFAGVVDAFGWTAALGMGAQDTSFVRNADVLTGTNQDFNPASWTQYTLADVADATPGTNQRLNFHAAVPEPATLSLAGLALVGAIAVRRRG